MSFEDVLRCHQRVNDLSRSLIGQPAFNTLHVTIPDPDSPETGFIRATSWLYCLYFEAGRVSLTFLRKLGEAYTLIEKETINRHIEAVRCLRTELHHNLGFETSDQRARSAAEGWRRRACGTAMPLDDAQWRRCYDSLVQEASVFLSNIDEVVRHIESNGEGAADKIEEWLRRLKRSSLATDFDPLIEDAKIRLGRDGMNTVEFRQRYLSRWRKQLDLLDDGFDFDYEATRLIERALLDEDAIVLPVSGRDIIDSLDVNPGPQVGHLLSEARKYYESTPCNKAELLSFLKTIM